MQVVVDKLLSGRGLEKQARVKDRVSKRKEPLRKRALVGLCDAQSVEGEAHPDPENVIRAVPRERVRLVVRVHRVLGGGGGEEPKLRSAELIGVGGDHLRVPEQLQFRALRDRDSLKPWRIDVLEILHSAVGKVGFRVSVEGAPSLRT